MRDMKAVRPIALMENISKVFEQIIIGRILKVIVDHYQKRGQHLL